MAKLAKISSKGQIVIPADVRKRLGYPRAMIVREEGSKVVLVPAPTFEDAFGIDGGAAARIATGISKDRRREVESELP